MRLCLEMERVLTTQQIMITFAATAGTGKASHHEFTVTGSESGQTWFSDFLCKTVQKQPGELYGQQDLILDNLKDQLR